MPKKLSKRAKNIINIVVVIALIAITMTVLLLNYKELKFSTIMEFLRGSNGWYIGAAFVSMLLFIGLEGVMLWLISRKLGHKSKMVSCMAYSTADVYYSALTPSATGGQPASLYYMVRDGMSGGVAGFTLIFNVMAYIFAIVIIGVFALAVRAPMLMNCGNGLVIALVLLGVIIQLILVGLLLMCMLWSGLVLKVGNGGISLLTKMRIIRKPEKWRAKLVGVVEKYRASKYVLKQHPILIIVAIIVNIAQRAAQILIPCFVCYAADSSVNFLDLFCMQSFVTLGYNIVPIPGGVGAYEFLYDRFYGRYYLNHFAGDVTMANSFMVSAMMVSRTISYYICVIISAVYTLIYHIVGLRRKKDAEIEAVLSEPLSVPLDCAASGESPTEPTSESNADTQAETNLDMPSEPDTATTDTADVSDIPQEQPPPEPEPSDEGIDERN